MMERLRAIVAEPGLTQDTLIEITSIYNNVGYVFLYLEANEEHVDYHSLLPWRDAFHTDPELDERILGMLLQLRCSDAEAETSRLAYVEQLRSKRVAPDRAADEQIARALAEAKAVLGHIRRDQLQLLARIGARVETATPSAVFYKLVSATSDPVTRSKLSRAWVAQRDARLGDLLQVIDAMVDMRRRQMRGGPHEHVLDRTLAKGSVPEADLAAFLERYLVQALASHALVENEVRAVTGTDGDAMDDFGFALQSVFRGATTPLFVLDDCLQYICVVAERVFGLTVTRGSASREHVLVVDVSADGEEVGRIHFDLWDTGSKTVAANHTKGIRNRTNWSGMVQRPVAFVSCRFQRGAHGESRITFQNVHSLFHEFGHAINHLLIRKRISNQSGLEYLPLERLELLSMWSEKWVYHPAFAQHVAATAEDREGVELCQRIKMLEYRRTYVERAVSAMLDFEVHRSSAGGFRAAFETLDDRFGISRCCKLGDFPAYFTWPMYMANPGAAFTYLWGAADSCEKFSAFERLTLQEVARRPELRELFAPCLDCDVPSISPDSAAVFAFYDPVGLRPPAATPHSPQRDRRRSP